MPTAINPDVPALVVPEKKLLQKPNLAHAIVSGIAKLPLEVKDQYLPPYYYSIIRRAGVQGGRCASMRGPMRGC